MPIVLTQVFKDPADIVDYELDFNALLETDTIASITSVVADNVTVDSFSFSGNIVTIFVSGGDAETTAIVTTTIMTTNSTPRTYERSFKIRVQEL